MFFRYFVLHAHQQVVVSTFSYPFYYFISVMTPTFPPSPWKLPSVAISTICLCDPTSSNMVVTPFPLFQYYIQYYGWYTSLLDSPMWDAQMDPSKPIFPFRQVGHCKHFTGQYSLSCPPASLLTPSSQSRISTAIIILCLPHHTTSLFSVSCISARYILLLSQSP